MKIVDAYKLKEKIARKFVSLHKNPPMTWDKNAELAMDVVDEQPEVLITCPKCNGTGNTYELKIKNPPGTEANFGKKNCTLCNTTGKITMDCYEQYQKELRDLEDK